MVGQYCYRSWTDSVLLELMEQTLTSTLDSETQREQFKEDRGAFTTNILTWEPQWEIVNYHNDDIVIIKVLHNAMKNLKDGKQKKSCF